MDRRLFLGTGLAAAGLMGLKDFMEETDTLKTGETRMPSVFVGHGSPMNAIENNEFTQAWKKIALEFPKPKAILCISAHWLTNGCFVTAMPKPRTIHDFGGFPDELYNVHYPAPGDPSLANQIQNEIKYTEIKLDQEWGLDHGTWSVTKHMYPDADIPILQMSIDYSRSPEYHYQLGSALYKLREKGILILGSGNIIHNLGIMRFDQTGGFEWAEELNLNITSQLKQNNHTYFLEYKKIGHAANLAIPTPDHYYPLLSILGSQQSQDVLKLYNNKLVMGSISMTSIVLS